MTIRMNCFYWKLCGGSQIPFLSFFSIPITFAVSPVTRAGLPDGLFLDQKY
jgi:hypothetical protein